MDVLLSKRNVVLCQIGLLLHIHTCKTGICIVTYFFDTCTTRIRVLAFQYSLIPITNPVIGTDTGD